MSAWDEVKGEVARMIDRRKGVVVMDEGTRIGFQSHLDFTGGVAGTEAADGSKITVDIFDLYVFSIPLYIGAATTITDPGTSYASLSAGNQAIMNTFLPADQFTAVQARIIAGAQGNEAGSGKGINIARLSDVSQLCEVTWNGNTADTRAGSWTAFSWTADTEITPRVKGASATEDIAISRIELQVLARTKT